MSNIERESAQVTIDANGHDIKSATSPFKASSPMKKGSKMAIDMHSNMYSRQSGEANVTVAHSTRGVIPTEMGNEDINSHFDFMKDTSDLLQSEKK